MSQPLPGRRERKKAATRAALADAALRLFLERGYDGVSVREVAEAADVSIATLFKHFPSKEALVFDQEDAREAALLAAIHNRPPGQSIPQALYEHLARLVDRFLHGPQAPELFKFLQLINTTPALSEYERRMWVRHEATLARAIAREIGAPPDDMACAALAHFALETPDLVRHRPDPARALRQVFDLIEHGWASRVGSAPTSEPPGEQE